MCWCVELVLAAAELIAGVCLVVQGDHGHVEDLRFPRCLHAGHLPDVLLTSGARQVRRRRPFSYLIFSKMQATLLMYHPDKILWSRRRVKSAGEEKNDGKMR